MRQAGRRGIGTRGRVRLTDFGCGRYRGSMLHFKRLAVAIVCVLPASGAAAVGVESAQASGPVALESTGVADLRFSPDSSWIVYARADEGLRFQLIARHADGTSGTVLYDGTPSDFSITSDSRTVVFTAPIPTDVGPGQGTRPYQLFSVPIAGGPVHRIDQDGVSALSGHRTFTLSSDGTRVLYLRQPADMDFRANELVDAPVTSGVPITLAGSASGFLSMYAWTFTPDMKRVVFAASKTNAEFSLYSVAVDGGADPTVLAVSDSQDQIDVDFEVSGDSSSVVYGTERGFGGTENDRLSAVPTAGGAPVQLSDTTLEPTALRGFQVSSDSRRVVYLTQAGTRQRLSSVLLTGGASVQLDQGVRGPVQFAISADGRTVAYRTDPLEDGFHTATTGNQLMSVPVAGGTASDLGSGVNGTSQFTRVVITPRSDAVVGLISSTFGGPVDRMISTPISGGRPTVLTPTVPPGSQVSDVQISFDNAHVLYSTLSSSDGELWSLPLTGRPAVWLDTDETTRKGQFFTFLEAPTGGRVAYNVDNSLFVVNTLPDGASSFVPTDPVRIFDTRASEPAPGPKGTLPADSAVDVQVAGISGVPTNASAVALNVTALDAPVGGFVTVWPSGQPRPLASSLNVTAAHQVRPNLVIVPIGADGQVSMYSQSGGDLIADVTGFFTPTSGGVAGGRLEPLAPSRLFDTRADQPAPGPKGLVGPDSLISVMVTGRAGVPQDAAAVLLNITATNASAAGFVTVWPAGATRPLASTVNLNGAGDTAPNAAIVRIGDNGMISLYAQSAVDLIADVTGYVTGSADDVSTGGLFVPLAPARVFDTRPGETAAGPKGFVAGGSTIETQVAGAAGVPTDVGLVALNVTASQAATGYVSAFPGGSKPAASTLNLTGPDDARANADVTPLDPAGRLFYFSQSGAHLLADVTGYTLP